MIDCGTHEDVCLGYDDVRAFPTTLFLENSANKRRKYQGKLGQAHDLANWVNKLLLGKEGENNAARYHQVFDQGCRLSGFVDVARVPGTLQFSAQPFSRQDFLNLPLLNISHVVHHLSFTPPDLDQGTSTAMLRSLVPSEHAHAVNPLDDKTFTTYRFHEEAHHFLQVVGTRFGIVGDGNVRSYQMTRQYRSASLKPRAVDKIRILFKFEFFSILIIFK